MMSDASDMLAAALEQMDGIIAGQSNLIYSYIWQECEEGSAREGILSSLSPLNWRSICFWYVYSNTEIFQHDSDYLSNRDGLPSMK